jgi:hypothetical protein
MFVAEPDGGESREPAHVDDGGMRNAQFENRGQLSLLGFAEQTTWLHKMMKGRVEHRRTTGNLASLR